MPKQQGKYVTIYACSAFRTYILLNNIIVTSTTTSTITSFTIITANTPITTIV